MIKPGNSSKTLSIYSDIGPLSILKRCVEEKLQVRVMTRQAVDARAICKGYIVAFDKYMNMVSSHDNQQDRIMFHHLTSNLTLRKIAI